LSADPNITVNPKDEDWLYKSAAVLLLLTAAAKLYGSLGSARASLRHAKCETHD
jgi:hypothetical protein